MGIVQKIHEMLEYQGAIRQILKHSDCGVTERGEYDVILTDNEDDAQYSVFTIPGGVIVVCGHSPSSEAVHSWASGPNAQKFTDIVNEVYNG